MTPPLTRREAAARRQLAAAVGPAHLGAAWAAYRDARMAGLCHEGAWEVALGSSGGTTEADAFAHSDAARRVPSTL